MKNFLILHGPMGVGKSTVSRHVCHLLQPSALLEGDWCWQIFPFCPHEENKEMALKHMIYLLNSYLHNKNISYLVFNWVLQDDKIFQKILPFLDLSHAKVHRFALLCEEKALEKRLQKDISTGLREADSIARSRSYLPLYAQTKSQVLDTTNLSPEQVAKRIAHLVLMSQE